MEYCDSDNQFRRGLWYRPDPSSRAKPRRLIEMIDAQAVLTQTASSGPVLWSLDRWKGWIKRHAATVGGNSE